MVAMAVLLGCGGTDPDEMDEGGVPAACDVDRSPFLEADCLTALRDGCRAQPTADECAARAEIAFDDGGYVVRCGWATVVRFGDASTCAMPVVEGRCEAGLVQEGGGDPCEGEPTLDSAWFVDVAAQELIDMTTALDGPLGPWSAVDAEPGMSGVCAENVQPPAPALCECAAAACTVQ